MYGHIEYVRDLQYKVKSLSSQVDGYKSGEKYRNMRSAFRVQLDEKDRIIRSLKKDLAKAHGQTDKVRKYWFEATDDLEKEHAKELRKKDSELKAMEKRALAAERGRDKALDKLKERTKEFYQVGVELEEEKGRNKKLMAQLNRDYENSSIPSSRKPNHKKIANNREKTGRKPGGQPGHEGHVRKKQTPTRVITIPAPEEYANSPDYRPTGRMITKQMIALSVAVSCDEYVTPEFRHVSTRQRVHAQFPPGVVDDVNYDGSVKAFAFLLNSNCCVSIDKVRFFISDITDGALNLSKGMINGLCKKFAENTRAEQARAFSDLLRSPVMNADCTSARIGGQNVQVYVCATPDIVMYFAREHKGHEGVKGTPIEDYQGILVHDHDTTFYSYGTGHQECMSHPLRYGKPATMGSPWPKRHNSVVSA